MEVEKKKDNNIKEEEKENNNGELYEKRINPIWSSIDDDDDDDVWSATLHKRLKSLERPKKKDEKTKFSSLDRVRSIFKSDHVSVSSNSNCSNSNSSSYSTLINVGQELDNYSLPSSHVETPKNSFTSISNSKKLNSYEHKKSSSLENNVIINDLSIENVNNIIPNNDKESTIHKSTILENQSHRQSKLNNTLIIDNSIINSGMNYIISESNIINVDSDSDDENNSINSNSSNSSDSDNSDSGDCNDSSGNSDIGDSSDSSDSSSEIERDNCESSLYSKITTEELMNKHNNLS
jgi:hypothetical protein